MPAAAPRPVLRPLPATAHLWRHVTPGDFIDGYAVASQLPLDTALQRAFAMPAWAVLLLRLRDAIVRPLGLRGTDTLPRTTEGAAGPLFPVTHRDAQEVVVGFDDRHLNFRISLMQAEGWLHMATWVHRNNRLGRLYLALVLPFHRLIVRDALRRIARG